MPIYLIISNFQRIIKQQINKIIGSDLEKETIYFDLNKNSILEVITEASYSSLFNDKKNIVVYNADFFASNGKITEKEAEALTDYFESPNLFVKLIFISSDKEDSRKKIVKKLKDNKQIFNYQKLSYKDLQLFIKDYLKEIDYKLNDEVINYLIKNNNQNLDIICNEIDKLKLCFQKDVLLEEAKNIISSSINDSIFKFIDEIVAKNYQKAKCLLKDLKTLKSEPTVIISLMAREFRLMLHCKIGVKNKTDARVVLLKDNLQDWQVAKVMDNAKNYTIEELKKIILLIGDYDFFLKSGKVDRSIVIDLLMMEFIK